MNRNWTMALAAVALVFAGEAGAQIIRPTFVSRPTAYASGGIGWLTSTRICNEDEDACWTFDGAPQYRASFELPLGTSGSWGLTATTARVPLRWGSAAGSGGCTSCDANVTVNQYFGTLHMGGNRGLPQIIDLSGGVTTFADFAQLNGSQLGTGKTITSTSFAVGLGIGMNATPRIQVYVIQEYAVILNKKSSMVTNNNGQQQTFRFGGRYAFGGR